MAFFHVRLSLAGDYQEEVKLDLSEDDLETQFIQPYRDGRPITVNGRVVDLRNLERIRVSRSVDSSSELIDELRARDHASALAVIGGPPMSVRAAAQAKDVTDEFIDGPPGRASDSVGPVVAADPRLRRVTVPSGPGDGRTVFLVHGRNASIASAMSYFLRSLDLKVIEWEQAVQMTGEMNPYIGDVLNAGLEVADGVVVLATPDDKARLDPALSADPEDPDLQEAGQPRQNVIYEAGMAMALAPGRTLIVAMQGTRILTDIAGRHLVYLDDSPQARKRIVGRLQSSGLRVDDSGDAWLSAGNFE